MKSGQYLSEIFFRSPIATSGSPALATKAPSPPSLNLNAAFGHPPVSFPVEKTPASCHERRTRIAPHYSCFRRR